MKWGRGRGATWALPALPRSPRASPTATASGASVCSNNTMAEEMKPKKSNTARALWIRTGVVVIVIAAAATGLIYWRVTSSRVYVDSASIEAPLIDLAPSAPGTLEDVYVKVGDEVNQNAVVARVGNELVTTQEAGIIVSVPANIGAQVSPQQPVATMIDPTQLRVVGEVDEDKGLDRI